MLQIEPQEVFTWFYRINQVPRESGHEEAISNFLVAFAKERGLEVGQDELWNVIIRKPASPGYEAADPVVIQGHMDMVCVKEESSVHDFRRDAIDMVVDGPFLRANQTSLGADNGIALAMQLALLDGNYQHPALEILVTTNEETTMAGAAAIQPGQLRGTRLLNLDSEEEGIFYTSCAGGATISSRFAIEKEAASGTGLRLLVHGLKGGHSGMEIDQGRANANMLVFRLLAAIAKVSPIQLVNLSGGSRDNVIPSRAVADILVADLGAARQAVAAMTKDLQMEFFTADPGLEVELLEIAVEQAYSVADTERLLAFFAILPNGPQSMSQDMEGLVQTSLNQAVLYQESGQLVLQTSLRSSMASQLEYLVDKLEAMVALSGGHFSRNHDYPSWKFEPQSTLREHCLAVYRQLYGEEAHLAAVHAGLECGFLKGALPDCDMISYGPNMYDVHSTKERLDIDSVGRVWEFTKALLASMK